jgi:intracellular sulfur oxidation DsrE/DsrF family protein
MTFYRVLFHLDDCSEARARMTLENIAALIEEVGKGAAEIELLANGAGVLSLIRASNPARGTIDRLQDRGVRFVACNRSRQEG